MGVCALAKGVGEGGVRLCVRAGALHDSVKRWNDTIVQLAWCHPPVPLTLRADRTIMREKLADVLETSDHNGALPELVLP